MPAVADSVILLHGLARSDWSMKKLEKALVKRGYRVQNVGYKSTLVRQYLRHHDIDKLGRVVMLGPPNKGSEVVDKLRDFPGFHFYHGDAGLELGTGAASLPNKLGQANFDLGVIAGTRSVNLFLSRMISGVNDGKVSVENTRVEGMRDHIEMEVTHTFMMRNKQVIGQVIHYLETGKFDRG
jgi:hypothetical protein